jgi:hypothetical protein
VERRIHAPDQEFLSRAQAAKWLNIGVDAWDALVARLGLQPVIFGPRTQRWSWEVVWSLRHLYPLLQGANLSTGEVDDPLDE